jgi:hypothetical protein
MSLTSLIREDAVLRNRIMASFVRPAIEVKLPIAAEPRSESYGLVGTAFDYMFRFVLENMNTASVNKPWIAELAIKRMPKFHGNIGLEIINNVKNLKAQYFKENIISRELVRQVIRMSYLDAVFREPLNNSGPKPA